MSIELLQTMRWSELCWDLSFEKIIDLDVLLPKIGVVYPVRFDKNENFAREGRSFILWQPPHSELNGWDDKRPTEILRSYVLEGILRNPSTNGLEFEFEVVNRIRLQDFFNSVDEEKQPIFSEIGPADRSLVTRWKNARGLLRANIGYFWYLSSSQDESSLEVILSYEKERMCLHYSATMPLPASFQTKITKYYLNEMECRLFEQLFQSADEITDNTIGELQENQIYGAEYW